MEINPEMQIALYSYTDENNKLIAEEGEKLEVLPSESGWTFVKHVSSSSGIDGYMPTSYLQNLEDVDVSPNFAHKVVKKYDGEDGNSDYLPVKEGDKVSVEGLAEGEYGKDWIVCISEDLKKGYVPTENVVRIKEDFSNVFNFIRQAWYSDSVVSQYYFENKALVDSALPYDISPLPPSFSPWTSHFSRIKIPPPPQSNTKGSSAITSKSSSSSPTVSSSNSTPTTSNSIQTTSNSIQTTSSNSTSTTSSNSSPITLSDSPPPTTSSPPLPLATIPVQKKSPETNTANANSPVIPHKNVGIIHPPDVISKRPLSIVLTSPLATPSNSSTITATAITPSFPSTQTNPTSPRRSSVVHLPPPTLRPPPQMKK